jgi:hypothetical protein
MNCDEGRNSGGAGGGKMKRGTRGTVVRACQCVELGLSEHMCGGPHAVAGRAAVEDQCSHAHHHVCAQNPCQYVHI